MRQRAPTEAGQRRSLALSLRGSYRASYRGRSHRQNESWCHTRESETFRVIISRRQRGIASREQRAESGKLKRLKVRECCFVLLVVSQWQDAFRKRNQFKQAARVPGARLLVAGELVRPAGERAAFAAHSKRRRASSGASQPDDSAKSARRGQEAQQPDGKQPGKLKRQVPAGGQLCVAGAASGRGRARRHCSRGHCGQQCGQSAQAATDERL